jgi:hypothetical protein
MCSLNSYLLAGVLPGACRLRLYLAPWRSLGREEVHREQPFAVLREGICEKLYKYLISLIILNSSLNYIA